MSEWFEGPVVCGWLDCSPCVWSKLSREGKDFKIGFFIENSIATIMSGGIAAAMTIVLHRDNHGPTMRYRTFAFRNICVDFDIVESAAT